MSTSRYDSIVDAGAKSFEAGLRSRSVERDFFGLHVIVKSIFRYRDIRENHAMLIMRCQPCPLTPIASS